MISISRPTPTPSLFLPLKIVNLLLISGYLLKKYLLNASIGNQDLCVNFLCYEWFWFIFSCSNVIPFMQTFLERKLEEHSQGQRHINHYIFTDSDIAVVDDLDHIFQNHQNFHLALTFRNNKDQPLNSGFIAVRGTPDGILTCRICCFNAFIFL